MKRYFLTCAGLSALFCVGMLFSCTDAAAQSRWESRAYKSAVKKMSLKSVEKFLKKYPESVYAEEMRYYRDSLWLYGIESDNDVLPYMEFIQAAYVPRFRDLARERVAEMSVSSVSAGQAVAAAEDFLKSEGRAYDQVIAAGVKYLNVEYVCGAYYDSKDAPYMYFFRLKQVDGAWVADAVWRDYLHRKDFELTDVVLHPQMFERVIQDKKYMGFVFECVDPDRRPNRIHYREFCLSLMDMEAQAVYSATFSGREMISAEENDKAEVNGAAKGAAKAGKNTAAVNAVRGAAETAMADGAGMAADGGLAVDEKSAGCLPGVYLPEGMYLEGFSADLSSNSSFTVPAMQFVLGYLSSLDFLRPVSDADNYTDMAYAKWYDDNEYVTPSANVKLALQFILLHEDSSLIGLFNDAPKSSSNLYDVAILDYRGHTSLVAKTRSKGQYILLWVEPQAMDKDRDVFLNGVYFRYPDVMNVYYFHGRERFKRVINLTEMDYEPY